MPRVDGVPLCKAFAFGRPCPAEARGNECRFAHAAVALRPRCAEWDTCGRCRYGEACLARHAAFDAFEGAHAALVCLPQFAERAAARAEELLGAGAVVGAARADTNASAHVLVLVGAPARSGASEEGVGGDAVGASTMARLTSCPFLMAYAHRVLRVDLAPAPRDEVLRACAAALPAGGRLRVRTFPTADARGVAEQVEAIAGAQGKTLSLAMADATHVLDLATAYGRAYASVWAVPSSSVGSNDDTSGDSVGAPPLDPSALAMRLQAAMGPGGCAAQCRAYYKMAEASLRRLEARGIVARPGWLCADIGAAPGGWSQWLSNEIDRVEGEAEGGGGKGHVWAIDPAELELSPMPPNVTHVREKLSESTACPARAAVAQGLAGRKLHLIACDANIHPLQVTRAVRSMTPLVAPGAALVVSMKNFCATRSLMVYFENVEKAVKELFDAGCLVEGSAELVHLLANGVQERCLIALLTGNDNDFVAAESNQEMAELPLGKRPRDAAER